LTSPSRGVLSTCCEMVLRRSEGSAGTVEVTYRSGIRCGFTRMVVVALYWWGKKVMATMANKLIATATKPMVQIPWPSTLRYSRICCCSCCSCASVFTIAPRLRPWFCRYDEWIAAPRAMAGGRPYQGDQHDVSMKTLLSNQVVEPAESAEHSKAL